MVIEYRLPEASEQQLNVLSKRRRKEIGTMSTRLKLIEFLESQLL
jgi:hypothetical protein